MEKNSLVVAIISVYVFIVMIAILLYALIKGLGLEISLATNLLTWSAAIFAPVVLLMTYDSWRGQKGAEVIALEASKAFKLLSGVELTSITCFKYMCEIDEESKKFIGKTLSEYEEQYEQIFNSLELITYVINDEALEKCFNDFKNTNYNFSQVIRYKIYGDSDAENIEVLEKNIDDITFNKLHCINELKVILAEYALYARKFKKYSN